MEGKTQETAAAKAGMSVRSARKWQIGPLPSATKPERPMSVKQNITALSLGGGVQSTALALLLDRGLLPGYPKPNLAVFADTQWKPRAVYDNIEWLKGELSYPVVVSTAGDLRQATHEFRAHNGNTGFTDLPLFTDGGLMKRQCTTNYKIRPIRRAVKAWAGLPAHRLHVRQYLGISADEVQRMRDSREGWITNDYPLAYEGWRRADCARWFVKNYRGRQLSRSACVGCPFRSAAEWVAVPKSDPELFADACELDEKLREMMLTSPKRRVHGPVYLHRRRKPLAQAVALDTMEIESQGRFDLGDGWGNECEGHCRV